MTNRTSARAWFCVAILAVLAACGGSNVGRLFDPDVGNGPGGEGDETNVQAVPVGGAVVEGRPRVQSAFPTGGGWPATVPIVVVFNESVNEDSVAPPEQRGEPATVFARVSGTTQALPATYDFLLGGTVVVIRPSTPLAVPEGGSIEVVVDPALRDVDGVRFGGPEPEIVATFTPDADPAVADGEILTTLPIDNARDQIRETPIYAIFTRPPTPTSVTTASFQVRTSGGATVMGSLSNPLQLQGNVPDPRVLRFDPATSLFPLATIEIVVTDSITFPQNGVLQFSGRTPFASFETTGVAQPDLVAVGNATSGFDDRINLNNFANLQIDVTVPSDAIAGDRVVVRLYGLDRNTATMDDLNFIERSADVPASGSQVVTVDFSDSLGVARAPRFDDGAVVITALSERGGSRSGFVRSSSQNSPRFDITPPSLVSLGPPTATSATDLVTDQDQVFVNGVASEEIGAATITVGAGTSNLLASDSTGRFSIYPVSLGPLSGTPAQYSLTLTDSSGNMLATPLSGNVVQRGACGGALLGSLTVEAFNDATLAPIQGASVVIEPGAPQKPATGQMTATTGADGRATFTGLVGSSYSVTIVAAGFDLVSLLEAPVGFVSLPLRPTTDPTGTLTGAVAFTPALTETVLVGSNVFEDMVTESVQTTVTTPVALPSTEIRPNRPIVLTGFSGVFPPTVVSTFSNAGCGLCGADSLTLTPPFSPPAAGESVNASIDLVSSSGAVANFTPPYTVDFTSSAGLGAIVGTPSVRVVASLRGIAGMPLFGVGFATSNGGTSYTVNGSISLRLNQTLALFVPTLFVSTEAQDASGNVARHRQVVVDPVLGSTFATAVPPGIPTITAPGGPITGSPSVGFNDRLDQTTVLGGFAFVQLRAIDPGGRRWVVLWQDDDVAVGATQVQLPDLSGAGVTGLANGSWQVQIENLLYSTTTDSAAAYVLENRFRTLVTYARAAPVSFTIQ